jgi:hypothetical protein
MPVQADTYLESFTRFMFPDIKTEHNIFKAVSSTHRPIYPLNFLHGLMLKTADIQIFGHFLVHFVLDYLKVLLTAEITQVQIFTLSVFVIRLTEINIYCLVLYFMFILIKVSNEHLLLN